MSRPKFSKGGIVRHIANRKYFDDGGIATNNIAPTNGTTGSLQSGNAGTNNNGLGSIIGAGNSFQAGQANIQSGTNQPQLGSAYTGANNAINAQVGLTNTLMPQATNAVQDQNAVAADEYAMTQGGGPRPALNQLAQTTNTNVNNQAALMAGQRGASQNAGLIAREAAQQGANTEQQAVGQAATLEAQQQIAAQQNLADLSNNQIAQSGQAVGNLNQAQQNEQNILQGANTAYNNAATSMQGNINSTNAATAASNQTANLGILGALGTGISNVASKAFGYEGGEVDHLKLAEMNAHSMQHAHKYAKGGKASMPSLQFNPVQSGSGTIDQAGPTNFGNGQADASKSLTTAVDKLTAGKSKPAQPLEGNAGVGSGSAAEVNSAYGQNGPNDTMVAPSDSLQQAAANVMNFYTGGETIKGPHRSQVANFLFDGGSPGKKVAAMLSPGERYLNPEEVRRVVEHGENPLKLGKMVPGKAKVKGDSLKNDIVPADLEDGGVVLPRHIMNKKDPEKAELFLRRAVHMKSPKRGA